MPQSLLTGQLKKKSRHIGFGVFIVHSTMPLKILCHLVQLVAIRILITNADKKIHSAFGNSGTSSEVW
jgi:hypothetical protein